MYVVTAIRLLMCKIIAMRLLMYTTIATRLLMYTVITVMYTGAGIACWFEHRTRDRKVESSNPGRSSKRLFFSRVNSVCWLLFSVHSTPTLPQWHVKDPGHSANSVGGRLHINTHTPLSQRSRSGVGWLWHCPGIVWKLSGNKLTHNLSGKTRPQSSQLTKPLWTDPKEWS